MKMTKRTRVIITLTIIAFTLIVCGYLMMILMYESIKNNNSTGKVLWFLLYLVIVLLFFSMVESGTALSIVNIVRVNKSLKNEDLPKDIKRFYIIMLVINSVTLSGGIMFLPIMDIFRK